MLPNQAPVMVAERFNVLEAAISRRSPRLGPPRRGTRPRHLLTLCGGGQVRRDDDFLQSVSQELILFERAAFPETMPFAPFRAMPEYSRLPAIWLLGSSGDTRNSPHCRRRIFLSPITSPIRVRSTRC